MRLSIRLVAMASRPRGGGRRWAALSACAASALAWSLCVSQAYADTRITVTGVTLESEVSPRHEDHVVPWRYSIVLSGHNSVSFSSNSGSTYSLQLGQSHTFQQADGSSGIITYTIFQGGIVIRREVASFYALTFIRTNGSSACSASLEFYLNPGHKSFEDFRLNNKEKMFMSKMRVKTISCSIEATGN
jgi:hypothetical protein